MLIPEESSPPMSAAARTLVMLATYNEIENIPALVAQIRQILPQADVLVVDDNSPDGTGEWVRQQSGIDARVQGVYRPRKLGLGTAIVAGMSHALSHGYDLLINMDADFSHPPQNLPDLLAAMSRPGAVPVDIAIGSRYIPGGGVSGWPWHRYVMSSCINWYTRCCLRLKARDCSGGYRCYRVARLAEIDLGEIRSRGYSFQQEMLWRLVRRGARVEETPIVFVDRKWGKSKIGWQVAASALWNIGRLGWEAWFSAVPAPRRPQPIS